MPIFRYSPKDSEAADPHPEGLRLAFQADVAFSFAVTAKLVTTFPQIVPGWLHVHPSLAAGWVAGGRQNLTSRNR